MMALVEAHTNGTVVPVPKNTVECCPLDSMDVPTSLAHQFITKLRSRNAAKGEVEVAEKMFQKIRFEDYEEKSLARLMSFSKSNSEEVIKKFCNSHNFSPQATESLPFAAALLDSDRSAETWIKFQQGEEGEFFVNFVALRRLGDQIHMGLARHHVKFRLAPFTYGPNSWEYGFYSWWQHFNTNASDSTYAQPQHGREQQPLSLEEVNMLENYFLLEAMKKFTEDFPANQNRLPYEDQLYLTM